MSDDNTARLALPLLAAGQAQKELLVNEALQRIDALVQPVAASAILTAPPVSPAEGTCWIVAGGATGAWAGQDGAIAQLTAGGWRFLRPSEGWSYRIQGDGSVMTYRAGAWEQGALRSDGVYIGDVRVVGSRLGAVAAPTGGTIVDDEARTVINDLLMALRTHGLIQS